MSITRYMRNLVSEQAHIAAFRIEAKQSGLHTATALHLIRKYEMHKTPQRKQAVHDLFGDRIRNDES